MRLLRRRQIRYGLSSSKTKNLLRALGELDRVADKACIPHSIREEAAHIYRRALDKGLIQGRSIVIIVAAALYMACRIRGSPRALREISKASSNSKKKVARCYGLLANKLEIRTATVDPVRYVSRVAEETKISGKTQGFAIRVLREAEKKRVVAGKDPVGLAAAALYMACLRIGEKKTQKELAEAAGVTEVTLRTRCKDLRVRVCT